MPQPHGGALAVGGTLGNVGGGRPPSAIRELCRQHFEARIPMLVAIADGEPVVKIMGPDGKTEVGKISATPNDRIKAIDLLGKYGGIEKLTIETPDRPGGLANLSDEQLFRVLRQRAENLKADRDRQRALRDAGVSADLDALAS